MNIYIMSRGRAGRCTTQKWIPERWRERTFFVVGRRDFNEYLMAYPLNRLLEVPDSVTNYSQKFQWLMDAGTFDLNDKCLIMDDDLVFSRRWGTRLLSVKDVREIEAKAGSDGLFEQIEKLLDDFALVGAHPRANGQHAAQPYVQNGRIICMQGINRAHTRDVRVDQHPILADVVLACTLLSRGLPNALLTTYFQDHGPCQAPGGCSIYRTPDMQRAAVDYLVARWPQYVKAVERRPKVAKWMGDVRYEYTCQWKKLFAAGLAWKNEGAQSPDWETQIKETVEVCYGP